MEFSKSLTPKKQVEKIVVYADMIGVKKLSEQGVPFEEVLEMMATFFDTATAIFDKSSGTIISYENDAIKIAFDPKHGVEAINTAITLMEKLDDINQGRKRTVKCSVGIARGPVIEIPNDLTGQFSWLARFLALAAAGEGIVAHLPIVESVNADEIKSKCGTQVSRTGEGYVGDTQRTLLKGVPGPVRYHEIVWGDSAKGLKSTVMTQAVDRFE